MSSSEEQLAEARRRLDKLREHVDLKLVIIKAIVALGPTPDEGADLVKALERDVGTLFTLLGISVGAAPVEKSAAERAQQS